MQGFTRHIIHRIFYAGVTVISLALIFIPSPVFSQQVDAFDVLQKGHKAKRGGNIEEAIKCLGWEYGFAGTIIKGEGRGRKLNFPTANIRPHISNQLLPANGVYCVDVIIENTDFTGMCNIGKRPTFYQNGEEVIEVHLFSNDILDLYEKNIFITFKKYLREEKRYNSSNELIKQLELDRQACFAI